MEANRQEVVLSQTQWNSYRVFQQDNGQSHAKYKR